MSLTAIVNAVMRAHHATHDAPKIFDDFLAAALFTPDERAGLEAHLVTALPVFDPAAAGQALSPGVALARSMRAQSAPILLARARYAEDRLEDELARGAAQYVVLGAGLDTFAFRRPELVERLHVFEVDHPVAQADKRRRIARAGWQVPDRLHFVALDFVTGDLAAALSGAGFDPARRTVFSWMGVTYYLARDTLFGTLRGLATLGAPDSLVVFDYLDRDAFDDGKASFYLRRTREIVARIGEPMQTGLAPETLAAELRVAGLALVEQLAPAELQARYFADRTDGYRAREHFHVAAAAVTP